MHKDWMFWIVAVLLFGAGCVAGVLTGTGVKVSLDPAWVQAIGSVAAILIAVAVAYSQRAWDRRRDALEFYRKRQAGLEHCKKTVVNAGAILGELECTFAPADPTRPGKAFFCTMLEQVAESMGSACDVIEDTETWAVYDTLKYALLSVSALLADISQTDDNIKSHVDAARDLQEEALSLIGLLQQKNHDSGVRYL